MVQTLLNNFDKCKEHLEPHVQSNLARWIQVSLKCMRVNESYMKVIDKQKNI